MSPTSPPKSEKKYIQSVKMIFDLKQKKYDEKVMTQ